MNKMSNLYNDPNPQKQAEPLETPDQTKTEHEITETRCACGAAYQSCDKCE